MPPQVTIHLPQAKKQIVNDITQHTTLICGEKGAGKTSFCLQYPDHFLLQCEVGNTSHLEGRYEDVESIEHLEAYISELAKPENRHYCKTLIIDEIQIAYTYYSEKVRKFFKMSPEEKFNYDHWRVIRIYFEEFIQKLQKLPFGVVYTAHVTWNEHELTSGKKISRIEPRLSGQCNEVLEQKVKLCGVIMMGKEGHREMFLQGDERLLAYNKFPDHFLNPATGKKHLKIPLGDSPEKAYNNFLQAYNNQLSITPQTQQPQTAGAKIASQPAAANLQQTPAKKKFV